METLVVIVNVLRGITAKLITGGFALRAPITLATRLGCIPLVMSTTTTATVWTIPTAGFYYSPYTDEDYYYAYCIDSDGIIHNSGWDTSTSYGETLHGLTITIKCN